MGILDLLREFKGEYNKLLKKRRIKRKLEISKSSHICDLLNNGYSIYDSLIDIKILNNLIIIFLGFLI